MNALVALYSAVPPVPATAEPELIAMKAPRSRSTMPGSAQSARATVALLLMFNMAARSPAGMLR